MDYNLAFEQPLTQLAEHIAELQEKSSHLTPEERVVLQELRKDLQVRTQIMYQELTSWQTVQVARHKDRPYALDYIRRLFDDFFELHGDRMLKDDPAIVGGFARLAGLPIMLIGQQKGRTLQEKQFHNFGMPHPEGYRKAYRLMLQAEKLHLPLVCLIDTPGAFPGLEDEERGQAGAIASNLYLMSQLRTPIVSIVIGEGGSGGALALGIADRLLMLEHSIYTVASPEAAASILWRDTSFAPQAAEAMQISARTLFTMHIIDKLVPEPLGGAHRNYDLAASYLKITLCEQLSLLQHTPLDELVEKRYQKWRAFGAYERADMPTSL